MEPEIHSMRVICGKIRENKVTLPIIDDTQGYNWIHKKIISMVSISPWLQERVRFGTGPLRGTEIGQTSRNSGDLDEFLAGLRFW